jgi:hypothetical protein
MALPLCGSRRLKVGELCTLPAGWGTDHVGSGRCRLHGGATRNGRVAAAKEEAQREAVQVMGAPIDVDPLEALLVCVRVAAGEAEYASAQVAELERAMQEGKKSTSLHPWIRVRQDALERLARFSKMAVDAGVAERLVQVEERHARVLFRVMSGVVADLDIPAAQRELVPQLVRRHLELISGSRDGEAGQT